ncbi:unnamed protein product, partial [Acanthoscelides obtectus]
KVHITRATLNQLGDKFEVEPGDGVSRESYLADHKVETFLIIPPKKPECKEVQKNGGTDLSSNNLEVHGADMQRSNSICCDPGSPATPSGPITRSGRPSSKMTKYVECWGADKPFANIADSTLAKNVELTVSILFLSKYAKIAICIFSVVLFILTGSSPHRLHVF